MAEFIKDVHYYLDGDRVVFTEKWLLRRGECCGNKCRHCPYTPQYQRGNVEMAKEFIKFKDNLETNE
jgi:hypothetical protein